MSDLPRILIVDNSRVVRASLAKHLQSRFDVREETNGEAAWQTLVLDSRIVAVISGIQMEKADGYELVERLRESRLQRLKEMPFLLIVSDNECEEGKVRARSLGVSDFITKLMTKGEILGYLDRLLDRRESEDTPTLDDDQGSEISDNDIDSSQILKQVGCLTEIRPVDPNEHLPPLEAHVHLLSGREVEARLSQALADVRGDCRSPVSVLALGIDNYEALVARFGLDVAKRIGVRFARLLTGKIGLRDSIGRFRPDCCVIVSREANLGRCYTFAGRVCRSMATAQISIRGEPVSLAICAGAASAPEDGALSAGELLALAVKRMEATRCSCHSGAGVREKRSGNGQVAQGIPALSSLAALANKRPETLEPCLGTVGLQLLPLLSMLEQEFKFGLPLPEMQSRLAERARMEEEQVH